MVTSFSDIPHLVMEDSVFSTLARVEASGANLQQADISSIYYKIVYSDSEAVHTAETSLTVLDVMYDALQTDGRWKKDAIGYNFRHDVLHDVLVDPNYVYEIRYRFVLDDDDSSEFKLCPIPIAGKAAG